MKQTSERLAAGEDDFAMLLCWDRHGRESSVPCPSCQEQARATLPMVLDLVRAASLLGIHKTMLDAKAARNRLDHARDTEMLDTATLAMAAFADLRDSTSIERVATSAVEWFLQTLYGRRRDGDTAHRLATDANPPGGA